MEQKLDPNYIELALMVRFLFLWFYPQRAFIVTLIWCGTFVRIFKKYFNSRRKSWMGTADSGSIKFL